MLHCKAVSVEYNDLAIHAFDFTVSSRKEVPSLTFEGAKSADNVLPIPSEPVDKSYKEKELGTIIRRNIMVVEEEVTPYGHVICDLGKLLREIAEERHKGHDPIFEKTSLLRIQEAVTSAANEHSLSLDVDSLKERIDCCLERINRAADQLVVSHRYLAELQARKFKYRNLGYDDLFQEGVIGLMRAAYKYDPAKEVKFSTYAGWWVRQSINRAIQHMTTGPRLPSHVLEKKGIYRQTVRQLHNQYGHEPSREEICRKSGLTEGEIDVILCTSNGVVSLDDTLGEDGSSRIDLLADTKSVPVVQGLEHKEMVPAIEEALKTLPAREEWILRLRYGIGRDGREHTLLEVGELLGISRERVRQIELRAQRMLQYSNSGLNAYL